jgi:hypothetical protein
MSWSMRIASYRIDGAHCLAHYCSWFTGERCTFTTVSLVAVLFISFFVILIMGNLIFQGLRLMNVCFIWLV